MNKDNTAEQPGKGINFYKDTVYGFKAISRSRTGAWQLIRNHCHDEGLEVPTMDKIVLDMPEDNKTPERDFFKENNNVEWNEQGEPLYTAKQVEDFIKDNKTPENGAGKIDFHKKFGNNTFKKRITETPENSEKGEDIPKTSSDYWKRYAKETEQALAAAENKIKELEEQNEILCFDTGVYFNALDAARNYFINQINDEWAKSVLNSIEAAIIVNSPYRPKYLAAENRNKELEREIEKAFKEGFRIRAITRNFESNEAWQQYKSQNSKAFKTK